MEPLTLSGLQHYAFCPRQWALIYMEQQWAENVRTVEGDLFHRRAHDQTQSEMRGDTLIVRGLRVESQRLGVTGVCDVVEFRRVQEGITLAGRAGFYEPYPVEYKRGEPKPEDADALQLCAQAMCLEEMLCCRILEGSLFYGKTRRRERVELTQALRARVEELLAQMQALWLRGHTPKVKARKGCNACSLKDICLPRLGRARSVRAYLEQAAQESVAEEEAP